MDGNDNLLSGGSLALTDIEYPKPDQKSGVVREAPEVDASRGQNVKIWLDRIQNAKKHFEPVFKQMRDDMRFARGKQWEGDNKQYVANLTQRHIRQRVSAIYAKNPTFAATRRKRIEYTVWDGDQGTLQAAMQQVAQAMSVGQPAPELAQAILADVQQAKQNRQRTDRICKTLEILFRHQLTEARPSFKKQMKQLVRRVLTCKVGYVKLGYQRIMGQSEKLISEIKDHRSQIEQIEMLTANLQDGLIQEGSAQLDELKLALESMQGKKDVTVREGLVFDFPKATNIIIDPECTQLNGFVGASWIAEEMMLTKEEIQKIYNVDLGTKFTSYTKGGGKKSKNDSGSAKVYVIYDIDAQLKLTVCEGYPDFLSHGEPELQLEQFHPYFALTFNDLEDEDDIYPPSDIELIRPMQMEHNRSREGLREHRVANRPAFVGAKGVLSPDDKDKLSSHDVNELLELDIPRDVDIRTILQPKPNNPIDPAVYDTSYLFEDIQRTMGSQEADFGGTSGATATEASISEGSRVSSVQDCIDELDEFMSEMAREAGQVLIRETDIETVKRICGDGAIWPEYTQDELVDEIYLEIRAGSSGRPNRAMQIANIERVAPFIIQTPNLNPEWWLKQLLTNVDESIDIDDAIISGLPSIVSMNSNAQASTGNPATDPNAQGANGGNNAPAPAETAGGAQPAFTPPA